MKIRMKVPNILNEISIESRRIIMKSRMRTPKISNEKSIESAQNLL
jgi:hypothetical protein